MAVLTSTSGLELLKQYPAILFIDATRKATRYQLPLVEIVGMTATRSNFFVAFAFISDEPEGGYKFILGTSGGICARSKSKYLVQLFVMTAKNFYQRSMRSSKRIVPDYFVSGILWRASNETCVLLSNPRSPVKSFPAIYGKKSMPDGPKPREAICALFQRIVWRKYALPRLFLSEYQETVFQPAIQDIRLQRMSPNTSRRFLGCYTKKLLDEYASSRVESAHQYNKADIKHSRGDLLTGFASIQRSVAFRHVDVIQQLQDARKDHLLLAVTPLYGEVLGHISTGHLARAYTYPKCI